MHFLPRKRAVFVLLAVAAVMCLMPLAASADTTYDFSINWPNTALQLYTGPYASVEIDIVGGNAVFTVTGQTNSGLQYLLGGAGAFAANFSAPVTITNFQWEGGKASGPNKTAFTPSYDFSVGGGFEVSDFGTFNVTIKNADGFGSAVSRLIFTADPTGADFTDAKLVLENNSNSPDNFFAASHIFVKGTSSSTAPSGFAGNGPTLHTPIPGSVLLLGSGLVGLGLLRFRRRQHKS